jgi:hypothetical protein
MHLRDYVVHALHASCNEGNSERSANPQQPVWSKRILARCLSACVLLQAPLLSAAADEQAAGSPQHYQGRQGLYSLAAPQGWERVEKAGADVLFEDPSRRSTSIGVTARRVHAAWQLPCIGMAWAAYLLQSRQPKLCTYLEAQVNPVRIKSLRDFGTLDAVCERLLAAERAKASSRLLALLMSFELDSCRCTCLTSFACMLHASKRVAAKLSSAGQRAAHGRLGLTYMAALAGFMHAVCALIALHAGLIAGVDAWRAVAI